MRAWHRLSLLGLEYPHTVRSMENRVRANVARNSVEYRRQPAKLLGLKALLRPKENEKDLSAVISQLLAVRLVRLKISISRVASISNLSSNSRECRHRVKKVALLELREVLMAKAVASTKPKASMRRRRVVHKRPPANQARKNTRVKRKARRQRLVHSNPTAQ